MEVAHLRLYLSLYSSSFRYLGRVAEHPVLAVEAVVHGISSVVVAAAQLVKVTKPTCLTIHLTPTVRIIEECSPSLC